MEMKKALSIVLNRSASTFCISGASDTEFSGCLNQDKDKSSVPLSTKKNIAICCSGSVATVKVPEIALKLSKTYNVVIVCSKNALFFLSKAETYNPAIWLEFLEIGGYDLTIQDEDEWNIWNSIGDPVLHIEIRKWADCLLVAPASADLIAKASNGIADNLVLSVLRAWDFSKPCLLCPAMNTFMWDHPVTKPALDILRSWGWRTIDPVAKKLACNDVGTGALSPVDQIIQAVHDNFTPG
jgi:phosphopantothenoylcysteine decarboxylase